MSPMRPGPEALMLTALISYGASTGEPFGITPEMMGPYRPEYEWVSRYYRTYGEMPKAGTFTLKFPDFPFAEFDDVEFAAEELRQHYTKRSLVQAVKDASYAISQGDLEEAILAIGNFQPITRQTPMINALHDDGFLDRYDEVLDTVALPWPSVQRATGGLEAGTLTYLAARLGQGKSWSLAAIAAQALLDGRTVVYNTLEMSEEQIKIRMHVILGALLGIDVDHIAMRTRVYDVVAYRKLVARIRDEVPGTLYLADGSRSACTPSLIAHQVRQADLVVIDYIGLMKTDKGQRAVEDWRVAAALSNQLKEIANASSSRVLAAAQINREGDDNKRLPPKTKNLAQSDALGQDGDYVITHKKYSKSSMVYGLEKNRHGEGDLYWYTRFLPNCGDFKEITKDHADELRDLEAE